jgi:hypothetical protein
MHKLTEEGTKTYSSIEKAEQYKKVKQEKWLNFAKNNPKNP